MTRTCNCCGEEFESNNNGHKCSECKKPKLRGECDMRGKRLTYRETQILNLLCLGLINKEIAWEVKLTEGTIKQYLVRIFAKLDAANRTAAAIKWRDNMPRDRENLTFTVGEVWISDDPRTPARTVLEVSDGNKPLSMVKYNTTLSGEPDRVLRCTVEQFRYWIDMQRAKQRS